MRLAFAALSLLALPALAGPLLQTDAPEPIRAALAAEAQAEGALLEGAIGWELDLEGDGTTEWLVQGIYPFIGGNAVYVRTFLYDGADTGFATRAEVDLPRSLKAVAQDGPTITLTLYELKQGDPRCCPTGESYRTLTITP